MFARNALLAIALGMCWPGAAFGQQSVSPSTIAETIRLGNVSTDVRGVKRINGRESLAKQRIINRLPTFAPTAATLARFGTNDISPFRTEPDGTVSDDNHDAVNSNRANSYTKLRGEPSPRRARTLAPAGTPVFDFWYGDNQTFGQNGIPQLFVNVLGNVSAPGGIASLTYSLNGSPDQPLPIGPDRVRLENPGDFNAEIAFSSLRRGPNTVRFTATAKNGAVTRHTVTVDYVGGHTWPSNYSIDWSTVANIQDVAQVVDGKWTLQNNKVRIMQPGYDRMIDIGDMNTWENLLGTVELTLNRANHRHYGTGVIVGWTGHTPMSNSAQSRTGHPFPAWFEYDSTGLAIYANTSLTPETKLVQNTVRLTAGVKYVFKFRVTANSWGGSHFSFKVWPSGTVEPSRWQLDADGKLARGSVLIGAHNCDVSIGKINIIALNPSESSRVQDEELLSLLSALSLVVLWAGGVYLSSRTRSLPVGVLCMFLVIVPFCEPVTAWVIQLLQRETTEIVYMLLRTLGLPVIRQGFAVSVRGVATNVARECGSIRSSMALLIVCVLAARRYLRTWWKAFPFVLLSLLVSVIQNGMRVAALELLSLYVKSNFLRGSLRVEGGVIFFCVGLLMLSPVFVWLKRSERSSVESVAGSHMASGLIELDSH
jgi:exosortase